jgi:hypothetical protein
VVARSRLSRTVPWQQRSSLNLLPRLLAGSSPGQSPIQLPGVSPNSLTRSYTLPHSHSHGATCSCPEQFSLNTQAHTVLPCTALHCRPSLLMGGVERAVILSVPWDIGLLQTPGALRAPTSNYVVRPAQGSRPGPRLRAPETNERTEDERRSDSGKVSVFSANCVIIDIDAKGLHSPTVQCSAA